MPPEQRVQALLREARPLFASIEVALTSGYCSDKCATCDEARAAMELLREALTLNYLQGQ